MANSTTDDNNNNPVYRPPSPIRIDWASMCSSSREVSEDTKPLGPDVFKTPTSKAKPQPEQISPQPEPGPNTQSSSAYDRVYDIPTLMTYRGSLAGIGVFAKIKPEALTENLFQFMAAPPRVFKPLARSRGLSELSNRSRLSIAPQNTPHPEFAGLMNGGPRPQATASPGNSGLPQHDGFVRFLKQHASPPHHRVTAGGRIVPAGPHSPPPMFDYESLTGLVNRRRQKLQDATQEIPMGDMRGKVRGPNWQVPQPAMFENPLPPPNGYHPSLSGYQAMQNSLRIIGNQDVLPSPTVSDPSTSISLVPMGTFEDGSVMASCNGIYYRTYWNGMGTVVEPLSITSGPVPVGFQADLEAPPMGNQIRSKSAAQALAAKQPMPLANVTNRSSSESQMTKSAQHLESQQQKLKANLEALDRHTALHHYDLSQEQRASFVAQRRSLVEELDHIRRIREPSATYVPPLDVKTLAKRATDRMSKSRSSLQSSLVENKTNTVNSYKTSVDYPRKVLSPNAPPFVPSKQAVGNPSRVISFSKPTGHPVKISHELSDGHKSKSMADKKAHEQEESLDRDPEDPAMRVVHNSDIAYAARYEHQKPGDQKRYCTIVSEFQEALRRVRQQARLYGCAGGSSKDPAYDAEQDIWWAICDKDPIPLPTEIPDHVANPRPWEWANSAFNFRHGGTQQTNQITDRKVSGFQQFTDDIAVLPKCRTVRSEALVDHEDQGKVFQEEKFHHCFKKLGNPFPSEPGSLLCELDQFTTAVGRPLDLADLAQIGLDLSGKQNAEQQAQARSDQSVTRNESDGANLKAKENKPTPDHRPGRQQRQGVSDGSNAYQHAQPLHQQNKEGSSDLKAPTEAKTEALISSTLPQGDHGQSSVTVSKSVTAVNQPKSNRQRSYAKSEKVKGPKRVKSKQELNSRTPLRRHRHALKHVQSNSKMSPANTENSMNNVASTLPTAELAKAAEDSSLPSLGVSEPAKPGFEGLAQSQTDDISNASRRSLLSRTGQQLSPRAAAKRAKQFYDRSLSKSPLKHKHSASQLRPTRARVNLPAIASAHLKSKFRSSALLSSETKAVAVTSPTKDSFLRDMLRGTRYSSNHRDQTRSSPTKTRKGTKGLMSEESIEANKENAPASNLIRTTVTEKSNNFMSMSFSDHHGLLAGKAPSSLASSPYHASAFLPQYDGAGKAQTTTVQQHHGLASVYHKPKVNLPESSSYSDRPTPLGERSHNAERKAASSSTTQRSWATTTFGLDGSDDAGPPSQDMLASPGNGKEQGFDTRGLVDEDFRQKRVNPNTMEHFQAVDAFFDEIEAQEKEHMTRRIRQNTKTD